MVTYHSVDVDYFISVLYSVLFGFSLLLFVLYCAVCGRRIKEALDWSREGEWMELSWSEQLILLGLK